MGLGQHWNNDGAVSDVRQNLAALDHGPYGQRIAPGELRDLNYLTHAACNAGDKEVAAPCCGCWALGATRTPWSYTGDPEQQFVKWRKELKLRG